MLPQSISRSNFRNTTNCVCSNDIVTYECTVCNVFATVWNGTAFRCSAGEITLPNSDFGIPEAVGVCNNILVREHSVNNGCYTSELTVTFESALQNRSIECYADNGTHITKQIGYTVLHESTGNVISSNCYACKSHSSCINRSKSHRSCINMLILMKMLILMVLT